MGIQDIEPGVEMMLLEWVYRYVQTILSDSLLYSAHAHPGSSSNPSITLPDLIFAIQSHLSHSLIQQPSKSTLLSLASTLNSTPLPPISDRFGLRLPPREQCLANVNFRVVPEPLDDADDEEDAPDHDQEHHINGSGVPHREHSQPLNDPGSAIGAIGEEDAGDETGIADATMQDGVGQAAATNTEDPSRGIKRSLDEDDDYD
ncbi:unnamed protein product [Parajaminaea phylloscopi]